MISGYELVAVCSNAETVKKALELCKAGMPVVGFVLMERNGARRIVDSGAVRWLDKSEMQRLMHPTTPQDKFH